MTNEALKFISDELEALGINYEFERWTAKNIPNPYFIGEYNEVESSEKEENGYQETAFILTGTGRDWLRLHTAKETIEKSTSKTAILPGGNGIAVFYNNSLPVPTGNDELKRLQINLIIKEWSVD